MLSGASRTTLHKGFSPVLGCYSRKNSNSGVEDRFSGGIEERACGNSRGQLKKKWNFQWCSRKTRGISMGLDF